ncbi:MAG: penicillin-insensitive murein endopeptidase [Pseudobdellovibrio sp.]
MKKILITLSVLISFGCSSAPKQASPEFAKWAAIKSPTSGETHIYGTYQAGCISGAKKLPISGKGYQVVRTSRERFYGHQNLVNYLTELGKKIQQNKYPTMMIGDMSYPRGGPFYNGHASHQIGLDVDISFNSSHQKKFTNEEIENWPSPSFVQDRKILLATWGKEQTQLVELAADFPEVNRIFVSPAIKKYFCETHKDAPWLYKLRSWWGHDDHIHVRLSCPADSPDCKSQTALDPKNNSCGTELDWWFSAEADTQATAQEAPGVREFPVLPPQCETVKTNP